MLADEGTTIVKFFLHISKDEQKERLQERLDDPDKHWKFNHGDLSERAALGRLPGRPTRTRSRRPPPPMAPWHVIPADRKWYRNLAISGILIDALERLDMRYPEPVAGIENIRIED